MKPPRSDRPRGQPASGKPYSKPHQASSGNAGRSDDRRPGKPQGASSYASSAGNPRSRDGSRPDEGAPRTSGLRKAGPSTAKPGMRNSHGPRPATPRVASAEPRFERGAKPGFRSERPARSDPPTRSDRPERSERTEKPVRDDRQDRRPAQAERPRSTQAERPRSYGADRPQRAETRERPPLAVTPARVQDRARDGLDREHDQAIAPRQPRPNAADTPRGTVWLYGTHAVQAALANPARRLRRLLATEEGLANLSARLPQPWAVQAEPVERARLDQMLGRDSVHQGLAVLADLLPQLTIGEILERPGPVLVLDQVTDPRNVGAILRSAAAFGVAGVIVQERHAPEETGSLAKAASGALETVPLLRAVNLARTLVMLKAADCWVVGLDAEATQALHGPSFAERRVALVLGGEGEGLRRLTRESCDELAKLPMPGVMESLNVSAAAAVSLYELGRKA